VLTLISVFSSFVVVLLSTNSANNLAVYGVGSGAVDPAGDGASVEPCVFGTFFFADLFAAGVGDGLLVAAVVPVWVVPDCSHDTRNAMPIRTAITETICFFIGYTLLRAAQRVWLS
jgi:hypothetical protein